MLDSSSDLHPLTLTCGGCGGVGFIWRVLDTGELEAGRCDKVGCPGQQIPVTLPSDLLDAALRPTLMALRERGLVVCSQAWDSTWPRQKVWRIRLTLPSGLTREQRDTRWLNRAALRLLQTVKAKGVRHGEEEERLVEIHTL